MCPAGSPTRAGNVTGKVNAPVPFGPRHLYPAVADFLHTYPEVRLGCVSTSGTCPFTLAAADAARSADLRIDSEGGVAPKKKPGKLIVPLAFSLLALHGLDSDGSAAESGATASNGFGVVGRIIGIAVSSRELATGIGAYAAAQSFYNRWLTRGQNVTFPKNTRIEVVTAPAPHRMAMPAAPKAKTN